MVQFLRYNPAFARARRLLAARAGAGVAICTALAGFAPSALAQDCGTGWAAAGVGLDGPVRALVAHDDGSGAALFAGGLFAASGSQPLANVARWDGVAWSALGTGVNGEVLALRPFGAPARLIVGGAFNGASDGTPGTLHIAQWDGQSWAGLAGGVDGPVRVLTVFDDGSGPALYAGGFFTKAGGADARRVARWNGESWSALGAGLNGGALAMVVYDDGAGPALYVGGAFNDAGGVTAHGIARWKNGTWSALSAAGINGGAATVRALEVFTVAGGPKLFAAGAFASAGGGAALNIARWNGFSWSNVGAGITGERVDALRVFDDGSGPALFAAGAFTNAGAIPATNIARWDGATWAALGSGLDAPAHALAEFDESAAGRAAALFVGGSFLNAGGAPASRVARWGAFGCVGPIITRQPQDVTTNPDGRAEFDVQVAGSEPITFIWRRAGQPLTNGANIAGADSPRLVIEPASILDIDSYDVVVSGPGGDVTSESAALAVVPACPGDATGDGRVNFIDISAVMVDWGRSYLPMHATGSGDANGDAVVNFLDITTILQYWDQNCSSH